MPFPVSMAARKEEQMLIDESYITGMLSIACFVSRLEDARYGMTPQQFIVFFHQNWTVKYRLYKRKQHRPIIRSPKYLFFEEGSSFFLVFFLFFETLVQRATIAEEKEKWFGRTLMTQRVPLDLELNENRNEATKKLPHPLS